MTTLGNPELPPGWSKASQVYHNGSYKGGGHIWIGDYPATDEDIAALLEYYSKYEFTLEDLRIEKPTLVGVLDRNWITFKDRVDQTKLWNRQGGWGSRYYMHQKTAEGVEFTQYDWDTGEQKPIFHYNEDGEYVKTVPGKCGEHHWVDVGDTYYDAHVGPAPGSEAEKELGDSKYVLNKEDGWWEVKVK